MSNLPLPKHNTPEWENLGVGQKLDILNEAHYAALYLIGRLSDETADEKKEKKHAIRRRKK